MVAEFFCTGQRVWFQTETIEMAQRLKAGFTAVLLLISMLILKGNILPVTAESNIIYVDDGGLEDYATIQEAINTATTGDIIYVYNGTYRESIVVNKTVSLIGEDPANTIIEGDGADLLIVSVISPGVFLGNFTVQNTTSNQEAYGISVLNNDDVTLHNNVVKACWFGILLTNSTNCGIIENRVIDSYSRGICLRVESSYNNIVGNSIIGNPTGIYVTGSCLHNVFYRNNIANNEDQVFLELDSLVYWDNGAEGNYWSDYRGVDLNGDGVGDTKLPHVVDNYPLLEPWSKTRSYGIDPYTVIVSCNCTIASFAFNQSQKQISFLITGPVGWNDSCNVMIPTGLLSPNYTAHEKWIIMLGSNPLTDVKIFENDWTKISFNLTLHQSPLKNRVRLKVGQLYPPTADFRYHPSMASINQLVNFTDESKGWNGTIIWRQWNFGDGNITITNVKSLLHSYSTDGIFNVTFTVKDDNDLTDAVVQAVLVSNVAPVANFTYTPGEPRVDEEVTFDASASYDPDGSISTYSWDFGDGKTSEGKVATHTFTHVKLPESYYKVTLVVNDFHGANSSATRLVFVEKGVTKIDVEAPPIVKVEEYFFVNATLQNSASLPLEGERIYFYDDDRLVFSGDTNNTGVVRANISLGTAGEHLIRAEFKGSLDYLGINGTTSAMVNLLNTALVLDTPSENVTQNEVFTVFAVLTGEDGMSVANAEVKFCIYNGTAWKPIGSSITNQSGVASLDCTLQNVGSFMLKAQFDGSGTYAAVNSTEQSVTVVAVEKAPFQYVVIVLIVVVVISVAFLVFRRKKVFHKVHS